MKKDEIKRFMPVALFTSITSMIIVEVGATFKLWALHETVSPLSHTFTYHLGLAPVATLWLYKFTFEKFWRYVAVEVLYNLGFVLIFIPWLALRGIRENIGATSLTLFLIVTVHGLLLYVYQMWQEDALVPAVKKLFSPKFQPAAAKPSFKDEDDKNNS
ncbi:hypothetical protein ACOBQJ_06520 [Pelotomaculum propionicicum]|uniref:hypothetical protein n=1 Tax=Pelotomaculum propionicicum TaxID=258475 RepID=UPI003B7F4CDD